MPEITLQQAIELAVQHYSGGRRAQAGELCGQILESFPQHWPAMHLLGVISHESGDSAHGAELIRRAIAIEPNFPDAHNNLGEVLRSVGRFDEAAACYARAIALNPKSPAPYVNLGELYRHRGQLDPAIAQFRKSLELDPSHPTPWMNMGIALQDSGRIAEAIDAYRKSIGLAPHSAAAHTNLGTALMDAGCPDEALAALETAVRLDPQMAACHANYATALTYLHRIDEAVAAFEKGIAIDPNYAEAHNNLAHALLLRGDWERGFEEYDWRWRMRPQIRKFPQPIWDGSDPRGRRILVHMEQGLGDAIQFVRYLPILAGMGASIVLECFPSQTKLLVESLGHVADVIEQGRPLPEFDCHIPVLSLPRAMRTRVDAIPASIPYLRADAARVEAWRGKLGEPDGTLRVGLVWAGRTTYAKNASRSISPPLLAPLAAVPGIRWYSLQKGAADHAPPEGIPGIDLGRDLNDFSDTAAVLSILDLLITADTAPAHVAGALGRPVWTMLPFNNDWRWLMEGETTAWYPTMRLFRQPSFGDWTSVVHRVAEELAALVHGSS